MRENLILSLASFYSLSYNTIVYSVNDLSIVLKKKGRTSSFLFAIFTCCQCSLQFSSHEREEQSHRLFSITSPLCLSKFVLFTASTTVISTAFAIFPPEQRTAYLVPCHFHPSPSTRLSFVLVIIKQKTCSMCSKKNTTVFPYHVRI